MSIPNQIYFCHFGGKPLSIVNYVAVKAALEVNNPDKIFFHYDVLPSGTWWEKLKVLCEPVRTEPIEEVFGQKLVSPAHKADVWRIQTLLNNGGIYLDTDVICNTALQPLLDRSVVLGEEMVRGKSIGLCNAAILAKPGATFLKRWWDGYDPEKSLWKGFRSTGEDMYWEETSVKYPLFLSHYWANEVDVVPFEEFYGFNWTQQELKRFFETNESIPNSYIYHLWSNKSYELYLKDVTEESLKSQDTNFSRIMLKYL